jgi:hypothetical protein
MDDRANSSTSGPTPTWITVSAFLLGAGIGVGVLLPSAVRMPLVEIGAGFWEALTSLGTLAAAVAAVYTARKAIAIDERVAERARDRERRDAIPLAYALHYELQHVAALMSAAEEELSRSLETPGGLIDTTGTLRGIRETARQFDTPILKDAVTALGCFDTETGSALGVALAATQHYVSLCNSPELDASNLEFEVAALRSLLAKAAEYRPIILAAVACLDRFLKETRRSRASRRTT